jgi:hypothetical protein
VNPLPAVSARAYQAVLSKTALLSRTAPLARSRRADSARLTAAHFPFRKHYIFESLRHAERRRCAICRYKPTSHYFITNRGDALPVTPLVADYSSVAVALVAWSSNSLGPERRLGGSDPTVGTAEAKGPYLGVCAACATFTRRSSSRTLGSVRRNSR